MLRSNHIPISPTYNHFSRYAKSVNSEHFSTSAKTGAGVSAVFQHLAESITLLRFYFYIEIL